MPRKLAVLLIAACLSNCASLSNYPSSVAQNLSLAAPLGPARRIEQKLTAFWPGRTETLLGVVELDNRHIAVAGLDRSGVTLFSANFDGKNIVMDKSPLLPSSFKPEFIIRDLQLTYWPETELEKHLPAQWRLVSTVNGRVIYQGNNPQFKIDYLKPDSVWPRLAVFNNLNQRYRLRIETLSYETLSE